MLVPMDYRGGRHPTCRPARRPRLGGVSDWLSLGGVRGRACTAGGRWIPMTAPHGARCAAERRLAAFVATSDEVVWELDRDGLMTYVSAPVGRHLGYEPVELIGQGWQAIMPSSEHQRGRVIIERAVAGGRGWDDEEFVFTTKAGHLRPMWSSGLALRNDRAAVLGVAGTLRPVRAGDRAAADERSRQRIHDIIAWRLFEPVFQPIIA